MNPTGKGGFQPGQSGNPKGRSKRRTEDAYLRAIVSVVSQADMRDIAAKARDQAKRGDSRARQWLSDYLLGKPLQRTDVTSDGQPLALPIEFNYGAAIAGIATRPDADSDAPGEN